jgi:hypothetical protein
MPEARRTARSSAIAEGTRRRGPGRVGHWKDLTDSVNGMASVDVDLLQEHLLPDRLPDARTGFHT